MILPQSRSRSINDIIQDYNRTFPSNWMDVLNWIDDNKSKNSYTIGRSLIRTFEEHTFVSLCRSVINGEFLLKNCDELQNLEEMCQDEVGIDGVMASMSE